MGRVQEVRLVPAGQQLADGLTKQGQKSCDLMKALQTGKYYLPGGFKNKKYAGVFSRTWSDLSGQKERERLNLSGIQAGRFSELELYL